ncbi:MAG: sugar phosphate isomerase/epimerase family protein [Cetobacterium sp.]
MLKIGLESESLHLFFQNKRIDIFDFVELANELKVDGVQINIVKDHNLDENWGSLGSNSEEHLKKLKSLIDKYNMFVEIDMRDLEYDRMEEVIKVAKQLGADVIRSYVPVIPIIESTNLGSKGAHDFAKVRGDFNMDSYQIGYEKTLKIIPLLKKNRIKLALENHEYETSEELVELIKRINSPWVGFLFDFGNSMMAWEEPLKAAENMAPYTFSTHFKDHIIIPEPNDEFGHVVCGVPAGKGNIDLKSVFNVMMNKSSLTRINVEMCYPYCAQFKRKPGTGGVFEVGKGAFKVEEHIYDKSVVKPLEYYYPQEISEELLEQMLEDQMNGIKHSIKYLKKLRKEYQN